MRVLTKICILLAMMFASGAQAQDGPLTKVEATFSEAKGVYTLNGGRQYEEWFRKAATLKDNKEVTVELSEGTTHYYLNLVDENKFLRSYPEVVHDKESKSFAGSALSAGPENSGTPMPASKGKVKKGKADRDKAMSASKKGKDDRNVPFNRWDTNKDEYLSSHADGIV